MKLQLSIVILCCLIACADKKGPAKKAPAGDTLHYDLTNPQKFYMPDILYEISGIAFSSNDDTIYAEQDEEGILFHFKPGSNTIIQSKFGKKGDFEDVAIYNNIVIMLRSDGVLFTFPLSEANNNHITGTKQLTGLLPAGEYEGLYADAAGNKLYALCKHCSDGKTSKYGGGYIFNITTDGSVSPAGSFGINVKDIEALTGEKKITFHPSALAKNLVSNQWYILSSVNKLLVVADSNWQVKQVYPLNPSLFVQPEGIAFDKQNNLYISNEGSTTSSGNILKFTYKP